MKKFFLFASAALVLASCSSEAEEAVIKPNETPEEEVLELTEIKLGGGAPTASAETRAAVEVNEWADTPVGIFGVNEITSVRENNWSTEPSKNDKFITDEKPVILLNEPAKVASPDSTGGAVTFLNANKIYFPRTNNKGYGYTFLGYYPYLGNTTNAYPDSITVTGEFDGTQDIMAGKSKSVSTADGDTIGYNAKYIREYRSAHSEQYPDIKIEFKHLTSKIDVQLLQGSSYDSTMCNVYAAWFEVEKNYTLIFKKVTSGIGVTDSLVFSARDTVNAYAIGGGVFEPNTNYNAGDVVKYNNLYYKFNTNHTGNGSWTGGDVVPFEAVAAEKNTATQSHTIFVTPEPVSNRGKATKTLYLVLNDDPKKDIPVTVTSPEGGFEAGKAYKVTVKINGPEEISVKASIVDWVDGGSVGAEI